MAALAWQSPSYCCPTAGWGHPSFFLGPLPLPLAAIPPPSPSTPSPRGSPTRTIAWAPLHAFCLSHTHGHLLRNCHPLPPLPDHHFASCHASGHEITLFCDAHGCLCGLSPDHQCWSLGRSGGTQPHQECLQDKEQTLWGKAEQKGGKLQIKRLTGCQLIGTLIQYKLQNKKPPKQKTELLLSTGQLDVAALTGYLMLLENYCSFFFEDDNGILVLLNEKESCLEMCTDALTYSSCGLAPNRVSDRVSFNHCGQGGGWGESK